MVPERPKMVPEGLGSIPEGSGMSRNHPRRSRNGREWSRRVLEGHGRFWKLPEGSTRFRTIPYAPHHPYPWGARHPKGAGRNLGGGGATCGRSPPWTQTPRKEGLPLGVGVPGGLHHPLLRPRVLLATYIMRGGGGGAEHLSPKAYVPPSLPLNPVAPQLDPGLDVVLDRNPLGFSPSSFLDGVLLWTAERCWIAATGCVDTGRGIITLILLRGASSSSRRSVRGTCSWDRSMAVRGRSVSTTSTTS